MSNYKYIYIQVYLPTKVLGNFR